MSNVSQRIKKRETQVIDEKRMTKIMDYYMELCRETNKLQTSFLSTFFIVFDLEKRTALFKRHMFMISFSDRFASTVAEKSINLNF
jgi:hypothetical protein